MSAVVLSVLPATATAPRAAGTGPATAKGTFAGVLETIRALPDASAPRKPATGGSESSADGTSAEEDTPQHGGDDGAAPPSGPVDVSLLMQAALTAGLQSAASVPSTSGGTTGAATPATSTAQASPAGQAVVMPQLKAGTDVAAAAEGFGKPADQQGTGGSEPWGPSAPAVGPSRPGAGSPEVQAPRSTALSSTERSPAGLGQTTPYGAASTLSPVSTSGASSLGMGRQPSAPSEETAALSIGPVANGPPASASLRTAGVQADDQPLRRIIPDSEAPALSAADAPDPLGGQNTRATKPATRGGASASTARAKPQAGQQSAAGSGRPVVDHASRQAGAGSGDGSANPPALATSDPVTTSAATASVTASALAPPPVAQQIATALQSLVRANGPVREAAETRALAASSVTHVEVSASQNVKNLTVDLDPGHLGPVSITLRMTGDTVSIHIAVANPDTLHMMERDRHVLTAAITAMGGSAEALQLGRDTAATNATGLAANGSGQQAAFSSDGATTGRQASNPGRRSGRADQETSHDDAPPPVTLPMPRLDGSLYV